MRAKTFSTSSLIEAAYRPFTKRWVYFDSHFNGRTYQLPSMFGRPAIVRPLGSPADGLTAGEGGNRSAGGAATEERRVTPPRLAQRGRLET